jgi:alcohol dehydrogenase, propanol-preferring
VRLPEVRPILPGIGEGGAIVRAMQLRRPAAAAERPLEPADLPVPDPGRGEVLIRVEACGVCHTDLHIVEGELPPHTSPVVPGHQIVGEVADVGPNVSEHDVGDRVGVPWLHKACGHCRYCVRGDENLCERALFTGYDVDGGFAEYVVAPAAFAYRLPTDRDAAGMAPLLCAGIIGYRSLRLSRIAGGVAEALGPGAARGRRLGLYGFGAAAHICLQVAHYWGAETYVYTRSEEHRELARDLGAVWAGPAGAPSGSASPAGAHDPLLDAAIVFAPAGELVLDALQRLDKGGTVALGGIYSSPIPPIDYPLIYDERIVRSVANSTRQDARELLALAAEIPIETEVETFELDEANDALLALKESRIRGAGVLRVG